MMRHGQGSAEAVAYPCPWPPGVAGRMTEHVNGSSAASPARPIILPMPMRPIIHEHIAQNPRRAVVGLCETGRQIGLT
jgi:hypothetical protein